MSELLIKKLMSENKYKNIFIEDKSTEYYNTFTAYQKEENGNNVFLKIYNKDSIDKGPSDILYSQIEREEKLTKICECENVVKLYKVISNDNDNFITFEYEYCTLNLDKYFREHKILSSNHNFFIKIVRSLANAIKKLEENRIIHRDIKPYNIFINQLVDCEEDSEDERYDIENNCIIKLGDFSSSIEMDKNDNAQIGTIVYTAPEILKKLKYSEKCDMWSLGVTLYHIYFGNTPYNTEYDIDSIMDKIYSDNFIYNFSGIPTLDILFKRLLELNPEKRMTHGEFYEYVNSEEFMKPNAIYKENIYGKEYEEIKKIKISEEYKKFKMMLEYMEEEGKDEEKQFLYQIKKLIAMTSIPNVLDLFLSLDKDRLFIEDKEFINIIYYNEDNIKDINNDINLFEEETTGAFIYCDNISKFDIIIHEIGSQYEKYKFDLIVSPTAYDKAQNSYLNNNLYRKYFRNITIYSNSKVTRLNNSKIQYFFSNVEIVEKFIKAKKSKDIKPYPITKLVTYEKYKSKLIYFYSHLIISSFYGDLNPELYAENFEKIKNLIEKDNKIKKVQKGKNEMIESFKVFEEYNINEKLDELNKKIIKEYTKNTFYGDLNRWLREINICTFKEVAYFTSRLMLSLNEYGSQNNKYYNFNEKTLYRGIELDYTSLLAYERAKNKKIIFTAFTSMTEVEAIAKERFGRFGKEKDKFSVLFYITNLYEKNWISNAIDIQKISIRRNEQEVLYQPFSFYIITDVKINIKKNEAEIYLRTIGKKEILEEALKNGRIIEYNEKENIVEAK